MKRRVPSLRAPELVLAILVVATLGVAGCDHYVCSSGPQLSGTCTATGTGIGSTGTNTTTAAFAFVADPGASGSTGTIDGYTLDTTGNTFPATTGYTAPTTPAADNGIGMVIAQKTYLYTGFASTSQIFGWAIDGTGNLTALAGSPYTASFMPFVPAGFGVQSIATNPAGTLLFFSSSQGIYVYTIGTGGALTLISGSPFTPALGGNLATDALGKYLYETEILGNHTGSQIAAFAIQSSGILTPVLGTPFPFNMWQVQGDSTGQFLIGTTGLSVGLNNGADDNHLYVFSIGSTGALTEVGSPFATLYAPLAVVTQPNSGGNFLYSLSIADDDLSFNGVEGLSLSTTGTLADVSGSPFSGFASGDVGAMDQSGAFLFVSGATYNPSTQVTTYQLAGLNVGSTGALTQTTSNINLPNGGFFAVTDPQ